MATTLHENIRSFRKQSGLSQERVAELIGVTRQAVTKWESGQTAPSTENLMKLADIFGTAVDSLIGNSERIEEPDPLSSGRNVIAKPINWKKRIFGALLFIAAYLVIFLFSRILYADWQNSSFIGALFSTDTHGNYLLGWLLHKNIFWISAGISSLPAFFGKNTFSLITLIAFVLGLFIGEIFGVYPAGIPYGHGHYGWAIWIILFLVSILVGILVEIILKRRTRKAAVSDA